MIKKNTINEFAKRSIELESKVQEKLGKKTFKDIWIGDGWLSKNKQGTVTFKPAEFKKIVEIKHYG